MKKLILVFLLLISISPVFGQTKFFRNKIAADTLSADFYFILNGDTFQIMNPSDGQFMKRINGKWTNTDFNLDSVDYVDFKLNALGFPSKSRRLVYDAATDALAFYGNDTTLMLNIGEEVRVPLAYNNTVDTIFNGTPVYINGAFSGSPTIETASYKTYEKSRLIGVTTQDIAPGSYGRVTRFGYVNNIPLTSFSPGDNVYLGDGVLTNVRPSGGNYPVVVGEAITCTTNGRLLVYINSVEYTAEVNNPSGWASYLQGEQTNLSFDNASRTVTITPVASEFYFYQNGIKYIKTGAQNFQISAVEGLHIIYYDAGTLYELVNPSTDQIVTVLRNSIVVSVIYWDATNSQELYFSNERHTFYWPRSVQAYMHLYFNTRYQSGLAPNTLNTTGNGSLNAHAQFGVGSGVIADEDVLTSTPSIASTTGYPVYYRIGSNWRRTVRNGYAFLNGTTYAQYNLNTGGVWSLSECISGDFINVHIVATNSVYDGYKVVAFMGTNKYLTASAAELAAPSEITGIRSGGLPFAEFKEIATFILETKSTFTNSVASRYVKVPSNNADFIDWRNSGVSAPSGGSGGGTATTFLSLTDTPSTYAGQANKLTGVSNSETGVEFKDVYKLANGLNIPAGQTYQVNASPIITQNITNGVTVSSPSEDAVFDALATKQATLVSQINIKSVNGSPLPGSGDLQVGDITGVAPGTGMTGGGTVGTVTLTLSDTSVSPGSYTNPSLTIDQQGRITSAVNGTSGIDNTLYATVKNISASGSFQLAHALLKHGEYLYAGERIDNAQPTEIARIIKYNANTLTEVAAYEVGANLDVESMCYDSINSRIYATRYNLSQLEILSINPATMTLDGSVHIYASISPGASPSIVTDGSFIYGVTYTDPTTIFKISLADWSISATATWTGRERGHATAISTRTGYFYATTIPVDPATNPYFAKIALSNLAFTEVNIGTYVKKATDDFAVIDDGSEVWAYVGGEYNVANYNGVQVKTSNLTLTGISLKNSYALTSFGNIVYVATTDGYIQAFNRFDLANVVTYKLNGFYGTELITDYQGRLFMSNWVGYSEASGKLLELYLLANGYDYAYPDASGSGGVTSVFGRTGAVLAQTGDYTAAQVTNAAATNSDNTFTGDLTIQKSSSPYMTVWNTGASTFGGGYRITDDGGLWRITFGYNNSLDEAYMYSQYDVPLKVILNSVEQNRQKTDGVFELRNLSGSPSAARSGFGGFYTKNNLPYFINSSGTEYDLTAGGASSQWNNDTYGINYTAGNVGIGTSSNQTIGLMQQGSFADGNSAYFYNTSATGNGINSLLATASDTYYGLKIRAASSDKLRLTGAGTIEMIEQGSSPDTPASGYGRTYTKTDGKIYFKNDSGTEYDLTAGGGGTNYWQQLTGAVAPATITDEVRVGSVSDMGNYKFQVTGNARVSGQSAVNWSGGGSVYASFVNSDASLAAGYFRNSSTGGGIFVSSYSAVPAILEVTNPTIDNSIETVLELQRWNNGSPGTGAGARLSFKHEVQSVTDAVEFASISSKSTDVTAGSEDGSIIFSTVKDGTVSQKMSLDNDGRVVTNSSVDVGDDSASATSNNVGAIRYRVSGNNSYCEMVMQTGASTYAWVIIKQNTW